MEPARSLVMSGAERVVYGGIVTLVRDGEVDVHRWSGPGWLLALAAYCDAGGWKVRVISTPTTIYRDLQGTRANTTPPVRPIRGGETQPRDVVQTPERQLLARIKRIDLLA